MGDSNPTDHTKRRSSLRRRAEEMLRTAPTDIREIAAEEVQRQIHELQVHQLELELQNQELREAKVELSDTRDRYADLYEFAPVGYVTLDIEGQILEANLTAVTMLGVEREALLRANIGTFVTRGSQDACNLHRQAVFSAAKKQTCEIEMHTVDGMPMAVRMESIAFGPDHDRRCRTALVDITAARDAQRRLEESERRFRRLTEAVTDYVYHVRVEDGRPVGTIHGSGCEAVTGYTLEEFAARSLLWIAMVPAEDRAIVERQASSILSGQDAPPVEHRICRKDDQVRWVLNTVSPQRDERGQLVAYDGLIRDITDRKQAEFALKQLNEELEQRVAQGTREIQLLAEAVSHLGEGVVITDDELDWPGPCIRFVNEAMCRITGYTVEELVGKTPRILQGEHTDRAALDRIKADLSANRPCHVELTNYRKDGTAYDAELFITALYDAEGRRTNFVSIHRDVTERKRARESLRSKHELSEGIINSAQHIILVLDTEGRIVRFNPYMEQLSGWQLAEVRGRDWFVTFLPERDRERVRELFGQALRGERTRGNANAIVAKDGRELEVEWHDAPLTSAEGKLIGLLCTGQDITERKRAEEALRESEERLRTVLNTAADAIITIDQRGTIYGVNPAAEKMFGYANDELVGRNLNILMPSPYQEEHDGYIQRYLQTGEARIIGIEREVVGRRKDGSTFPVDLAVSEVERLGLFTGIIRDITERKELQGHVLEIANERQRRIGQELHDGTGQELTGLSLFAGTLSEILSGATHGEMAGKTVYHLEEADYLQLQQTASRLSQGLTQANRNVHELCHGIMPVQIDAEGLRSALEELAAATDAQKNTACRFECPDPVAVTNNTTATHLYRIAQEALHNALRHSQADQIQVSLSQQDGQIILEVRDNGVGIDPAASRRATATAGGMGLRTMDYRAGMIGGVLRVERNEPKGTLVSCTVPRGANSQ